MFANKNTLVYLLVGLAIFFILTNTKKENFETNSGLTECYKMDTNMCSAACCGQQWPLSFNTKNDPRIKEGELGDKYISTNMSCSGTMGTGCICASKKQYDFLSNRGNNN